MFREIEFKLEQDGIDRWEDTPVLFRMKLGYVTREAATDLADQVAEGIVRAHNKIVRWEFEGVGNGHYTHPFMVNR